MSVIYYGSHLFCYLSVTKNSRQFCVAGNHYMVMIRKRKNFGAGDEIRTHDLNLGKVSLYP